MTHPLDRPFSFGRPPAYPPHEHYDTHLTRRLASMAGYYLDSDAYTAQLAQENPLVYEVYEIRRPEQAGELLSGLSILHPGKVGAEYFMTKGHFHAVLETGEIYHDYGTIEKFGFRKLLVEQDGQPTLLDNPRWQPPETRR